MRWPGAARLRHGAAYRLRGGNGASDASWQSEGPSEEESSGERGVQGENDDDDDDDDDDDEQEEDDGDKSDFMDLSAGVDDDAASQRADAGAAAQESESEGENLEDLLGKFIGGDGSKDGSDSQDISNEWSGLLGSPCPPFRAAPCALSVCLSRVIAGTARPGTRSSSACTHSPAPPRGCGYVAGA